MVRTEQELLKLDWMTLSRQDAQDILDSLADGSVELPNVYIRAAERRLAE